jgi:hypothetical protein
MTFEKKKTLLEMSKFYQVISNKRSETHFNQAAVAPSLGAFFKTNFHHKFSGEVSRSRRYCNAWPTRDEAGASS